MRQQNLRQTLPTRPMIWCKSLIPGLFLALSAIAQADTPEEMILGTEIVQPGIKFVFEAAIKDIVQPAALHLQSDHTDIHLEARVGWDDSADATLPGNAVPGSFVPYLHIKATVTNETSGQRVFVDLTPHINLGDNFHYARNMALPGSRDDRYRVRFDITGPYPDELATHFDWRQQHEEQLIQPQTFTYEGLDFQAIAQATRR